MTREQVCREAENRGFHDLTEDFSMSLVRELESGYEKLSLEESKIHWDKCWFDTEAIYYKSPDRREDFYFVPRKYL